MDFKGIIKFLTPPAIETIIVLVLLMVVNWALVPISMGWLQAIAIALSLQIGLTLFVVLLIKDYIMKNFLKK